MPIGSRSIETVKPLHEREPDDAVEDQQRQLVTGDRVGPGR